ncbi:MAG: hypothetical protein LUD72_14030 [Bacteroidales bacterium]|nr:hypothetical protein [Bacteroidales bacterium]
MIIINKNRDNIINMDNVTNIYLKNDRRGIQVSFTNGQGCLIGEYENMEQAKTAMELLWFRLDHHSVVALPTDAEVRAQLISKTGGNS